MQIEPNVILKLLKVDTVEEEKLKGRHRRSAPKWSEKEQ